MLGISTSWWENRAVNGDALIGEALEMGFDGIELEYRITGRLFHEMKPRLNSTIKVLSIHNYFPRPEEFFDRKASGDLFLLSSIDREEQSRAVKYSIRSIEHASDLETGVLVLHLGRVDMPNPMESIRDLYGKERMDQEEGRAFLEEQDALRASRAGRNLDAILFSLDRLNKEAEKRGVFLGVENRYYLHEIPNFEEIGIILRKFDGGMIRYWHDTGHAAVQENLGICRQQDLLKAYAENMIGIHFHDVDGLNDHLSPGYGRIDYGEIIPFAGPSCINILEVKSRIEKKELMEGSELIRKLLAKGNHHE